MASHITERQTEHGARVRHMFDRIAPVYDFMNRLMSARRDVYWRKRAVAALPNSCSLLLDAATGTGDIAVETVMQYPGVRVIGVDFSRRLLERFRMKTARLQVSHQPAPVSGDILALPFPDDTFDAVTIAFGLRNIHEKEEAVIEMSRVLKPNGRIVVLEMTLGSLRARRFFRWYLGRVIPLLGRLVARDEGAYRYLPDSIKAFLAPDDLTDLLARCGLVGVSAVPLTLGICYVHTADKPPGWSSRLLNR